MERNIIINDTGIWFGEDGEDVIDLPLESLGRPEVIRACQEWPKCTYSLIYLEAIKSRLEELAEAKG